MDANSPSSWRPEPGPQNALERQLPKMAADPALHGQMFRMLWEAELTILIPDHPEVRGEMQVGNGDTLTFMTYQDSEGRFIPVFTSEAAADYAIQKLFPKPWPGKATTAAKVIFRTLNNGINTRVVINPGLSTFLTLPPDGIASLVTGEFTRKKAGDGEKKSARYRPLPAERLPEKLCQGIRDFCDQRRVPIGVYVFNPFDPEMGDIDVSEIHILLWLRHENGDFFNDFSLMIGRLTPDHLTIEIGVITPDNEAGIAYLKTCTPLWPVMPG